MENKFTKGEWYLQPYTDAYTNIIRCNRGIAHETYFIASTTQNTSEETRYNAQLMAKSPLLLETLFQCVNLIKEARTDLFSWPERIIAKELVQRAEQLIKDATTLP